MDITKEEFEAYEAVRASGVTNMLDVGFVCRLTGLSREKTFEIIRHYEELKKKYTGKISEGGWRK